MNNSSVDLGLMAKRTPRIDNYLEISLSTFGNTESYSLFSLNISTSGLLLAGFKTVPFNKTSLLEARIDPSVKKLKRSIECLAKVARVAKGNSKGLDKYKEYLGVDVRLNSVVGIYFTEITPEDRLLWTDYVHSQAGQDLMLYSE